jgi:uncharacterized protein
MDGLTLTLFLTAAFLGGLISGLSGFAMGIVVSGVWLHFISPEQNAALVVLSGLVTQGSGIWRVRHALNWRRVMPFIVGGAIGVPMGTLVLTMADPEKLRVGIGALLISFGLYGLLKPTLRSACAGTGPDFAVGIGNGLIAGVSGLGGIAVTVWCQLLGGSKDSQRAIFQPVMFATFAMSAVSLGVAGAYTAETLKLYALALPLLVVGIWCGLRLYGKLDDTGFRKVILFLLLACGLSLVLPAVIAM